MIYGITGKKFSGKDTLTKFIAEIEPSFFIHHFADDLKRMVMRIFGLSYEQVHNGSLKELTIVPIDMDVFILAMAAETNLDIKEQHLIAYTPRDVLQYFGTEYVRRTLGGENYWVNRLMSRLTKDQNILIPDVRFLNEAAAITSKGGKIIKIVKTDAPISIDLHASEVEQDQIVPDLLIGVKTGNFISLKQFARMIVAST